MGPGLRWDDERKQKKRRVFAPLFCWASAKPAQPGIRTRRVRTAALPLPCQLGLTGSRNRSSSLCARFRAALRGRCIGHRAQREVGRTGIEALQANQPRLMIVEMPACFRIAWQNTQHAIGPFERSIRHRLAAAAILLFLGRDPADLEGERRQIGMQFYGHQGTTQVDRRHRVVERGKRLGETPLIKALIHAPNAGCSRLRYPSDLTDDEWGLVEPLIPPARLAVASAR